MTIPKLSPHILQSCAFMLIMAAFSNAHAAIVISDTGSRNNDFVSGNILNTSAISFTSTANTAVFFIYSFDAGATTSTATFAGQSMTIVEEARVVIGYIAGAALNGFTNGDIVLNSAIGGRSELAYWGVVEGIDVTNIKTSVGSLISGSGPWTQTNTTLSSLNVGDVVYSGFAVNNAAGTAYSGGLAVVDNDSSGHDAKITTDTVGTAGNFNATTSVTADLVEFGASIAFTAIPEPSAAILGGLGLLMLLMRRRR